MAKDVITRFKLETTAYDSKLRDEAKWLADYTKTATAAGKEFGKFTQSNVEAARALGNIAPSANNAKDKVKELVGAFNDFAKAYNALTKEQQQSDFGKGMAESLSKLKVQITEAKQELYGMGDAMKNTGGGLFGGLGDKMSGMLQVFGGNMLTEGVSMLTSELAGSVQQSIELARQGEGIRIAFERLNQPGLLDELKAATHGTVSEIELMKQAIKFENFKLPVQDLANYLAFAQQKAKDTGESIDFLVTSIVNGLGRQSKQILDNLGISAAELRSRMNEGATMTQAVSDIIREEMAKAGDYVETAADRAARATAQAQDKAEAFGRTAMPVAQEWAETWATLSQDAMSFANTLLGPVAKSIRSIQNILNSGPDVDDYKNTLIEKAIAKAEQEKRKSANVGYQGMGDKQKVKAPGGYVEVTDSHTGAVIGGRHFNNLEDKNSIKDWQKGLIKSTRTSGSRSNTKKEQTELQQNQKRINDLTQQYVTLMAAASKVGKPLTDEQQKQTSEIQRQISELEKRNGLLGLYQEQAQGRLMGVDVMTGGLSRTGGVTGFVGTGKSMTTIEGLPSMSDVVRQRGGNLLDDKAMKAVNEDISRNLPKDNETDKRDDPLKEAKKQNQYLEGIGSDISGMLSGLEKMGIEIPEGLSSVVGGIQMISGIVSSILTLVGVISALTSVKSVPIFGWLLAQGGIAGGLGGRHPIHAAGGTVVGNTYSGDQIPAMLNAGEVVLNRAQQGNIASQLESGAFENLKLDAVISGEQIRMVLNNNGRRTGRGEYVTSNRR